MIRKIQIENFKSIEKLTLELGRINVFIGENGSGKTNITEAIGFASAAFNRKLENEFLSLHGIRNSEPKFFKSGFHKESTDKEIKVFLFNESDFKLSFVFKNDNAPFSKWDYTIDIPKNNIEESIYTFFQDLLKDSEFDVKKFIKIDKENKGIDLKEEFKDEFSRVFVQKYFETKKDEIDNLSSNIRTTFELHNFMIYAPENYFLRNPNIIEPYVEPLGYRGEGILKLIKYIKREKKDQYQEILDNLQLIDWFDNFDIGDQNSLDESEFLLSDKYLNEGIKTFDIRNANEGFLFLLFYLALFVSEHTPKFFAIDNIDTALNPKLGSKLISLLSALSKKYNKQVIFTTHNPSILDGLNLHDAEQKLFVISRNKAGYTRASKVDKKEPLENQETVKLSEQFLRGYIGGLPKNF